MTVESAADIEGREVKANRLLREKNGTKNICCKINNILCDKIKHSILDKDTSFSSTVSRRRSPHRHHR